MDDQDERLVTIASFQREAEFLVVVSRLDSAGIKYFVPNLHTFRAGLVGSYEGVAGGLDVQVRESDVKDALAILNDPGVGGDQPG